MFSFRPSKIAWCLATLSVLASMTPFKLLYYFCLFQTSSSSPDGWFYNNALRWRDNEGGNNGSFPFCVQGWQPLHTLDLYLVHPRSEVCESCTQDYSVLSQHMPFVQWYTLLSLSSSFLDHLLEVTLPVNCYLISYALWNSVGHAECVRFIKFLTVVEPWVWDKVIVVDEKDHLQEKILKGKVFMEVGKFWHNGGFGICFALFCWMGSGNWGKDNGCFDSLVAVIAT